MRVARRIADLPLSMTLALDARAKELSAAGRDIVNMTIGEPDFAAPSVVRKAAVAKIESGDVKYTPASGTLSLRAAIARQLQATRGQPYSADEVVVCHSAKHALSGALFALIEPGDEVLLTLPYWVSYADLVRLAGGMPVLVASTPDCRPDLARLAAAITPRTRGLLLNSPTNPTGVVWTEAELRGAVELAERHDLWIVSDEIYRRLTYGSSRALSPVQVSPAARARTVIVDGASKAYAMTGYRIGFAAGPKAVVDAIGRFHSQMTGSPNAVSQAAYEAGINDNPPEIPQMAAEFERRRDSVMRGLAELGLATPRPDGAFYAFPDVSRYLDARGSMGFCQDLLEEQGLAIVPGSAFGLEPHVRLSYALSMPRLEDGLKRLGAFLKTRKTAPATARR
jgi:aspartate aminotransferase